MGQQGITKKQSAMLQGLAILMMLYHHFFMTPYAYGDDLLFFKIGLVERVSWFCKICVGTFAFVSGYGMCRVLTSFHQKHENASFFSLLGKEFVLVLKQILKLWIRFWLILLLFMGIVFACKLKPFDSSEFISNLLCISTTYNGANWYVEQYAKMMIVLPLMDLFFAKFQNPGDRHKKLCFYGILMTVLVGTYLSGKLLFPTVGHILSSGINFFRPVFLYCFIVGYLFALFGIYEKFEKILPIRFLNIPIAILFLLAVVLIRFTLAYTPAYAETDYILVPFMVYGFLTVVGYLKPLGSLFAVFGKYSTYMWLTHVYLYDFTSHWLRAHLDSHLLFYAIQVALAFLVSVLLTGIDQAIVRLIKRK